MLESYQKVDKRLEDIIENIVRVKQSYLKEYTLQDFRFDMRCFYQGGVRYKDEDIVKIYNKRVKFGQED